MARIFSIYFSYAGINHSAMVSVRNTPFYTEYNLNILDEQLLELLPSTKIISSASNQYFFEHIPRENITPLMDILIREVSLHMSTSAV
ncbi:MAG: hypothetical protein M3413_04320 [Bacteroidota bacterium]|nr:hypothetical protein [Bacteroidota bacterium]